MAFLFNQAVRKSENKIASDRLQEAALEIYFDRMTELLTEKGLDVENENLDEDVEENKKVRDIARARTLTVLRKINGERKGLLIRFLYQSNLIRREKIVIDLSGADLSNANLSGTDEGSNRDRTFLSYLSLADVHLAGADLTHANMAEAKLSQANLAFADLSYADMRDAHLMFADLRCATLTGANFRNANLHGADLSSATGFTLKQFQQAKTLKGTTMPDGTNHD